MQVKNSQVHLPCRGCNKPVRYPAAQARQVTASGRPLVVFCSVKCNQEFVAREGAKAQRRKVEQAISQND